MSKDTDTKCLLRPLLNHVRTVTRMKFVVVMQVTTLGFQINVQHVLFFISKFSKNQKFSQAYIFGVKVFFSPIWRFPCPLFTRDDFVVSAL